MDAHERGHVAVNSTDDKTDALDASDRNIAERPTIVTNLTDLVDADFKFATVLADPPWRYSNTSSRGAAENHYETMTVEQVCSEPVRNLVADAAHLHCGQRIRSSKPPSKSSGHGDLNTSLALFGPSQR